MFKIGDTSLFFAKKIGESIGLPYLFLKLESENITKTQKDRAVYFMVEDAIDNNYSEITVGTCGNMGLSLALLGSKRNIKCTIFIPRRYKNARIKEIEMRGADIYYTFGGYEDAVEQSSQYAKKNKCYDANPNSYQSVKASLKGYEGIAYEISKCINLRDVESIWVPVGNGTTLTGINTGFINLGYSFRFGAVSSKNNNAILESFKEQKICELNPDFLIETHVNEPLLNWKSYQVKEVLEILRNNGLIYGATDQEMLNATEMLLKEENIKSNPASASVLVGITKNKKLLNPQKIHMLILTS